MGQVPDCTSFPTVDALHAELDALAAAYPALARTRTIGTSRRGDPLRLLTIGDGPANALVIGGPHPNEPIGFRTITALADLLCRDAELREGLGLKWHFVACADPDGARLNEGWYGHPGDRRAYARHFYRPDLDRQVEWTFPLVTDDYRFDRPLPETTALMRLMDEITPSLVCSLHNGEHQGVFYYLNRDNAALARDLGELAALQGLPGHHGEPEMPGSRLIAPCVYSTFTGAAVGPAFGAGAGSADYAAQFDALHLVAEVPMWTDARVADQSPAGIGHRALAQEAAVKRREVFTVLAAALDAVADDLTVQSPFRHTTEGTLRTLRTHAAQAETFAVSDRPATVAEEFDQRQGVHLVRLRLLGTCLRMLDAEIAAGNPAPAIHTQHELLTRHFDRWVAEAENETAGMRLEIRKPIAVQLAAILLAAQTATHTK
ncbi:M14 family zinc carboxypeptidase [Streptomyces sp. NPDC004327]|uniref:M14 family zinc carboxypeptidase n=1 Tax=Streptomyces sp. NPDC004327 TaxID=3364699 RepID=UPI0036C874E6